MKRQGPLQLKPGFKTNIAIFTMFPGFHVHHIEAAIDYGVKGTILRRYGSGKITHEYLAVVKYAQIKRFR